MERQFVLFILLAGLGCEPKSSGAPAAHEKAAVPAVLARSDTCAPVTQNAIGAGIQPRELAGEYRLTFVGQTPVHFVWHQRLWLWPTSMQDISSGTGKAPPPNDTAVHPLYGLSMVDSGPITAERLQRLRRAMDPIYPEVLVEAERIGGTVSTELGRMILLTNGAGRRDEDIIVDGGGTVMSLKQVDSRGFRGEFGPWGGQVDLKGYYCAERVAN